MNDKDIIKNQRIEPSYSCFIYIVGIKNDQKNRQFEVSLKQNPIYIEFLSYVLPLTNV